MDKEGSGWATDAERVCKVPLPWLRKQKVVPVRDKDGKLALAICHPSGWLLAQELGMLLGERLERPVLAREDDITDIINRIFGESTRSEGSVSDVLGDSVNAIDEFNEDAVEDLLEDSSEAPFIRLVNMILAQAVRAGASDIHIEPYRDVSRVRFRLDGVLYERHTLNKAHHAAVVSRIKVMAKLNIAEKRLPQDGRIAISLGGRQAGLRVSTLPTSFGERVVLRLLEKSERVLSLTELGLSREDLQLMHSLVGITHGIVLVTGPTGSGKTTTLYAVLQELTAPDKNILTIEDPVEYELEGVGQIQVNPKIGLTFADGLRSIVRQDPDVILIGEIRDAETAAIAVQSALTGHLVFSTLHTNDAPGAVTRLFDMGVEPFLLSSVLRGVVAQRLVRMLCPHCREAYEAGPEELREYVEAGGGFLSLHAGNSFKAEENKAYTDFVGNSFVKHPPRCTVRVTVDRTHPVTEGVHDFEIRDEHYELDHLAADILPLLSTVSESGGKQMGGYVRSIGKGRLCVLTPGHILSVWENEEYRKLVRNAVFWCAGGVK